MTLPAFLKTGDITADFFTQLLPLQKTLASKPSPVLELNRQLQKLEKMAQTVDPDEQLMARISDSIQKTNGYINRQSPETHIEKLLFQQQKKILVQRIFVLNDFVQQEARREQRYTNQFELQESAVNTVAEQQTVEMGQQLQVRERHSSMFAKVVNTLEQIASLNKQVAAQVDAQESSIFRILDNVDFADQNVERSNTLFARTIKNIKGRQGCLIKVFLIVFLWIVVRNLIRKFTK